jgi:RimJ/RimL family protein N-acetyltransferase
MEPVTITTERLLLRPFGPKDVNDIHRACQDPDIQRWTAIPSPYERHHAEKFVGEISPNGWRDETLLNFGVFTRDGGELVSSVGLVRLGALRSEERQAEIGYWTAKEQRGRGYTAESVRAVAHWAFTEVGVERLEWYAEAGNTGSRAVAVKAGFVVEGTLRSRVVHGGVRRDAWIGSLLPSDLGLPTAKPYLPLETPGEQ